MALNAVAVPRTATLKEVRMGEIRISRPIVVRSPRGGPADDSKTDLHGLEEIMATEKARASDLRRANEHFCPIPPVAFRAPLPAGRARLRCVGCLGDN